MKVLVTGGRGFIGDHVCDALRALDHDAIPLGRTDGDLGEEGVADRLLDEHRPDAVVHLAAVMPGDDRLAQNALIAGLVAVACEARDLPLFHGSTTSVYSDDTPYADSKRESEEVVGDATILRFHFPYGPGQRRGAIPTMLKQALAGEPIVVYRGWERSFCYIGDAALAVATLVDRGEHGDWDIGSEDDRRTLLDIAQLACELTGADPASIEMADPPTGPALAFEGLDTDRLRSLGWRPDVGLEDGMARTLEWLRSAA